MTITREPPWMCSLCGYLCDAVSPADPASAAVPGEGDISICLNCGLAHVRSGSRWRPMTKAERDGLTDKERDDLARAQAAQASLPPRQS